MSDVDNSAVCAQLSLPALHAFQEPVKNSYYSLKALFENQC